MKMDKKLKGKFLGGCGIYGKVNTLKLNKIIFHQVFFNFFYVEFSPRLEAEVVITVRYRRRMLNENLQ